MAMVTAAAEQRVSGDAGAGVGITDADAGDTHYSAVHDGGDDGRWRR